MNTTIIQIANVRFITFHQNIRFKNHIFHFIACQCEMDGSVSMECDAITGECTCKNPKITGVNCEKCDDERYGYPDCHRN